MAKLKSDSEYEKVILLILGKSKKIVILLTLGKFVIKPTTKLP